MKKILRPTATSLALALVALAAQAQTDAPDDGQPSAPAARRVTHVAQLDGQSLGFAAAELGSENTVKGAPYCADAVHESIQPLADGNRIVRSQTSRLCRDGEGRSRQEVERGKRRLVYLRDPVAHETWLLNPERKTATLLPARPLAAMDESAWRAYGERMRSWGRQMAERMRHRAGLEGKDTAASAPQPPAPPAPAAATMVSPGEGTMQRELRVVRINADEALPLGMPMLPGLAHRMGMRGDRGAMSPLGSKEIEGVKANGQRSTFTIEAGKIGNEKPIVITHEVWTSPELMLPLATRDVDPRSGEISYRLQNIRRGEPDAALMKVPADYEQIRPRRAPAPAGAAPASAPRS